MRTPTRSAHRARRIGCGVVLRRYAPRLAGRTHYPRGGDQRSQASDRFGCDVTMLRPIAAASSHSGLRRPVSTWTPGPIVDDTVIFLMYRPLADAGFARWISSMTARKFCSSAGGSKLDLPSGTWTLP